MESTFKELFENGLKSNYNNIFKHFKLWNDNGINEVNLTVQFTDALKKSLGDKESFTCFELTLPDRKSRIDGVVYSPKNNSIFFIESKRFKRNQPKYKESLSNDVDRLLNSKNRKHIISSLFSKTDTLNQYFIFIADHWRKGNSDTEVKEWFEKYENLNLNESEKYKDFSNIYSGNFVSITTSGKESYMVFIMIFKLK